MPTMTWSARLLALLAVFSLSHMGRCASQWKQTLAALDLASLHAGHDIHTTSILPGSSVIHAAVANRTTLKPQFFPKRNSTRVQMQYGPYAIPPSHINNGMADFIDIGATWPCQNCTITFMQAGLTYENGSYAGANTSAWLHHTLLINLARPDTVCGRNYYAYGQRFFASGNERIPSDVSRSGTLPTGYHVATGEPLLMVVELMNQASWQQHTVVTIDFEYIPGLPADFYQTRPIWLDIAGCHIASDMPAKANTSFEYSLWPPYQSNYTGAIIGMGAHLHDGGTHGEITQNGTTQCDCVASYGQTSGYIDQMEGDMGNSGALTRMSHISSISGCQAPTTQINIGDEWSINAYYNFTQHMPMFESDGDISDVMGISLVFVAENMTEKAMRNFIGNNSTAAAAEVDMTMGMGMGSSMVGMSKCPAPGTPGDLTAYALDLKNTTVGMEFLMLLLDDTCLQVWANRYAMYFWYGILAAISSYILYGIVACMTTTSRTLSAGSVNGIQASVVLSAFTKLSAGLRALSYLQISPRSSVGVIPSLGTILVVVAYMGFILALQFINATTGDDQSLQALGIRAAWLSMAQIPLIFLLATKKNVVTWFTAAGYERLNVLHRWTARGLLLTATLHFAFQNVGWSRFGVMKLEWSTDSCPPTGIAAYAILLWINLSSVAPLRHLNYEFFFIQHVVTMIGFIAALMVHIPTTALYARVYVYIGIGLYVFSRAVQLLGSAVRNLRPCRASLNPISSITTEVRIDSRSITTWTPGSHVLVSIPKFGRLQTHPATIASTPTSHDGDLVLLLRAHSGFTARISTAPANANDYSARVDGPYHSSHADPAAFESVVFVAGSTGLSYTLPILLDLAERSSRCRLPLRSLSFVLAVRDRQLAEWALRNVRAALLALQTTGVVCTVHVHDTTDVNDKLSSVEQNKEFWIRRTGTQCSIDNDSAKKLPIVHVESVSGRSASSASEVGDAEKQHLSRSISTESGLGMSACQVQTGRPDIDALIRESRRSCIGEMGVITCGPLEMTMAVRSVVAGMQWATIKGDTGGVYLHVEGFGS